MDPFGGRDKYDSFDFGWHQEEEEEREREREREEKEDLFTINR